MIHDEIQMTVYLIIKASVTEDRLSRRCGMQLQILLEATFFISEFVLFGLTVKEFTNIEFCDREQ